jgi:hypothetical protein
MCEDCINSGTLHRYGLTERLWVNSRATTRLLFFLFVKIYFENKQKTNVRFIAAFLPSLHHPCHPLDGSHIYRSPFTWVKEVDTVVEAMMREQCALEGHPRVCVVFFEALKRDLPAQLDRINAFLGNTTVIPL